jgi:hypothetical protein
MKKLMLYIVMFVLLTASSVLATTTITTCQDLTSDDTYQLGNDLVFDIGNATGGYYCIGLNSANIVVDCRGHKIKGDNSGGTYGIADILYASDVQIRNCLFEDLYDAAEFLGSEKLLIENSSVNHMGWTGFFVANSGSGNSQVFRNINFTNMRQSGIIWNAVSGISDCQAEFVNITDIDTGLPIEFYNTSVDISNREFSGLILCGDDGSNGVNSNLTNITFRVDYIPKWTDPVYEQSDSWGAALSAFGFDNLTISGSRFINTAGITLRENGGTSRYKVVDTNITNSTSTFPFLTLQGSASYCNYYNFTNILVDEKPLIYIHDTTVSLNNSNYSYIYLCNASGSVIDNVYANSLHITDSSDDVLVDKVYIKRDYGNIYPFRLRYADNVTIQNSYLYGDFMAVYNYHATNFVYFNDSFEGIGGEFNIGKLYGRYSTGIFYNNIINITNSLYTFFASASTVYFNNTLGGNYWTNAYGNGTSDACVDTTPADGICDSSYSPPVYGTDYMPLSFVPSLNLPEPPAPPPCSEGVHRCNGSNREVCSSGVWTFVETCTYGCNLGSCTEEEEELGIFGQTIADVGSGIGGFFTAIANPLAYILLILGIIAGITSIFIGVSFIIRKAIK